MGQVIVTPQAKKDFGKLPEREKRKIRKRLMMLESEIYRGKKLSGSLKELYSLKAWPYRIFYVVREETVWITHIEHRQGAYKK